MNLKNDHKFNSEKIKLIHNSDFYWDKLWSKIDKSQDFIFMITYDIDNKMIANLTLRKLLDALDRGVNVILLVEHLNFYMKYSLYKQLKNKGAIIIKPNPMSKIFSHITNLNVKKFFNRCHQKVSLIDNDLFIGSINIADEYSDIKYGSNKFIDLNIYIKNTICKKKVLNFFKELIDENIYQIKKKEKREILEKVFTSNLNDYKKNTINDENFEEFLEEKPPQKSEIQDNLYEILDSSKNSITIIQAYYNNIKRIEDILISAVKRGVKVKIITAEKRDQPIYKYFYNSNLFEKLLKNGVEIEEFQDKFFHIKAYYVDNNIISMGSFNNDRTSFLLNNEANYLIKKNENNEKLFKDFEAMMSYIQKNCKPVVLNSSMNPFRLCMSHFCYFFLWCMEKTVSNRNLSRYDN